jgi:hypothetical protein
MARKVIIETVPYEDMRYPTCGDWFYDDYDNLRIIVADLGNEYYEYLIADHELREAMLCKRFGVSEKSVTQFDVNFECERQEGDQKKNAEPGDDKRAPYYKYHQWATKVEKMTARWLGITWKKYNDKVNSLE